MKDFQNYLKVMLEAAAASDKAPVTNLESATTPIQAYMAYRRELNDLMSKVQGALEKVEMQIDAVGGKVGGYLDTAKTRLDITAQTASFNPTKARPAINRNRNQAMVDKYAPQATQGEGQ